MTEAGLATPHLDAALARGWWPPSVRASWFDTVCELFADRELRSAPSSPMGLDVEVLAGLVFLPVTAPWGRVWCRFACLDVGDRRDVLWCVRPDRPWSARRRERAELVVPLQRRYGGEGPGGWCAAEASAGWLGWVG